MSKPSLGPNVHEPSCGIFDNTYIYVSVTQTIKTKLEMKKTRVVTLQAYEELCFGFCLKRLTKDAVEFASKVLFQHASKNTIWKINRVSKDTRYLQVFHIITDEKPESVLMDDFTNLMKLVVTNLKNYRYEK